MSLYSHYHENNTKHAKVYLQARYIHGDSKKIECITQCETPFPPHEHTRRFLTQTSLAVRIPSYSCLSQNVIFIHVRIPSLFMSLSLSPPY